MGLFQELRIRLVIALRQIGLIPTYQWLKLELDRNGRKKNFKPEKLDESMAESARAKHMHSGVSEVRKRAAGKAWMDKLKRGDYSGPTLDASR